MVKAASEGLGFKAMTDEDYRKPLSPWMYVDATAAIGVAQSAPGQDETLGDAEAVAPRGCS